MNYRIQRFQIFAKLVGCIKQSKMQAIKFAIIVTYLVEFMAVLLSMPANVEVAVPL